MLLAVNYSVASADLLYRGIVDFDLFKAPAWLDLAAQARAQHPTYVHFPLIRARAWAMRWTAKRTR